MTKRTPTDKETRMLIADFLVEETMNMPDAEILAETRAEYGDENAAADFATGALERAWKRVFPNQPLPSSKPQ